MGQVFSNGNQSAANACYRFGDFELYPQDRLLKKLGTAVSLPPKSFDALLCMVNRAGHLVSKQELVRALWPDVYVGDANLTNTIVSLRKALGRDAIRTVSKHGYRFDLPVCAEPGVTPATYARFSRAAQLANQRTAASMILARDLLWTCLAEDPGFAAAWAYLGRCCAFLEKFEASASSELVQAAFQRAFTLDPGLACGHQFYTLVQVDSGEAREAVQRLHERLKQHPGEPESLAGLVQAYRFCGLLEESVDAHRKATAIDPTVVTGVAHTFFSTGDYPAAIEAYAAHGAYYLDAAAWAALGNRKRAIALLRKRLADRSLSNPIVSLMTSLLALLENRIKDAGEIMDRNNSSRDPEILVYFARHYSEMGRCGSAIQALRRAASLGFICAPRTLRRDPWFRRLLEHPECHKLIKQLEASIQEIRSSLAEKQHESAGGCVKEALK